MGIMTCCNRDNTFRQFIICMIEASDELINSKIYKI